MEKRVDLYLYATPAEAEKLMPVLREAAAQKGWKVHHEYTDTAGPSASKCRAGVESVLRDLRHGNCNAVIAWELSHFGSAEAHLLDVLEELEAHNAALVSIAEGIDTSEPFGRGVFALALLLSDLRRAKLPPVVCIRGGKELVHE